MKLALLVVVFVLLFLFLTAPKPDTDGQQARQKVEDGALLLDVRSAAEFSAGHLPGAKNIPVQELAARSQELQQGRALVLYCQSGRRSGSAAKLLKGKGFEAVADLGAMSRW